MRRTPAILVFDETVSGTGSHYSKPEMNEFLGMCDKYSFHMIASSVGAAANVTAQLEHGSDGLGFTNKNGTAEFNGVALSTTAQSNLYGSDAGTVVGQGLGRLRVSLSVTTVSSRIKIYAVGRDM